MGADGKPQDHVRFIMHYRMNVACIGKFRRQKILCFQQVVLIWVPQPDLAWHGMALVHLTSHCITLSCIELPGTLNCIALHWIVINSIALHFTALHYTALLCIALHCIALHCMALHCIALHCIALHCIALHCIALHCIALSCIVFMFHCWQLHHTIHAAPRHGLSRWSVSWRPIVRFVLYYITL